MAQRAPTMNAFEKLICSPYGRPQYKVITGKEVPEESWSDIFDVLVIERGILEAAVRDVKHDLQAYEYMQKGLHGSRADMSTSS